MKILEKTIEQMPEWFTSNEFNKLAIQNGYPARRLRQKGLSSFLRRYADNAYKGSKTWIKRNTKTDDLNDIEMIAYLKNRGYKIMKPIKDWVEC